MNTFFKFATIENISFFLGLIGTAGTACKLSSQGVKLKQICIILVITPKTDWLLLISSLTTYPTLPFQLQMYHF